MGKKISVSPAPQHRIWNQAAFFLAYTYSSQAPKSLALLYLGNPIVQLSHLLWSLNCIRLKLSHFPSHRCVDFAELTGLKTNTNFYCHQSQPIKLWGSRCMEKEGHFFGLHCHFSDCNWTLKGIKETRAVSVQITMGIAIFILMNKETTFIEKWMKR